MSESNKTPVATPAMMPGRNGGTLRRGGLNPKRNGGRPPSEIREKLRNSAWKRVAELERIADEAESESDRLKAIDMMLRYGIGNTVTETDTEGNDVAIRVIREPRTLIVDN